MQKYRLVLEIVVDGEKDARARNRRNRLLAAVVKFGAARVLHASNLSGDSGQPPVVLELDASGPDAFGVDRPENMAHETPVQVLPDLGILDDDAGDKLRVRKDAVIAVVLLT